MLPLKVPYYTVFHHFHTAVSSPTTLYSIRAAPEPSVVLNFSSVPAPLNANELRLSTPALPATRHSKGEDATHVNSSRR